MLVRFIPLQGWLLIWISTTLSDMSDSLFTAPLVEMHVYYYDDGLRWLINDCDYYHDVVYLTVMLVYLNVLDSGYTFIHV
jgi:hypothetical protein